MQIFLFRVLCGFCLGISVFAPGISGSVMAIILGIYDKILEITANPLKELKKNINFLFPLAIGAAISFVLFILVFSYLFETYEKATYMLFIGLIAGNLPVVFKDARKTSFKKRYIIGAVIAMAFALVMGVLSENTVAVETAAKEIELWWFGLSGGLAGFVSLIPGMSVSMILIVMNVYEALIETVKNLDIITIGVVGVAFLLAMVLASRLIRFVFEKFAGLANYMVMGFLIGSIGGIAYSVFASGFSLGSALVGVVMLAIGLGISLLFVHLGNRLEKKQNKNAG